MNARRAVRRVGAVMVNRAVLPRFRASAFDGEGELGAAYGQDGQMAACCGEG